MSAKTVMQTSPRIPRQRAPILPRWVELPSLARIAVGVVVGVLLVWGAR